MEKTQLKLLAGIIGVVALLAIAGGIYSLERNKDLNKQLADQEASIKSAKIQEEQKIAQLNKQMEATRGENETLNTRVTELNSLLRKREDVLRDLRFTNSKRKEKIDSIELQISELSNRMREENQTWSDKNANLQNELRSLNDKLLTMVPRSSLTADGFMVEAIKRNDKVTAKAKKVHDLKISFNIPSEMGLESSEVVYLSLTDLKGNSMMPPLMTMNVGGGASNKALPVHTSKTIDFDKSTNRISFSLSTQGDINPGTYRASIFTKENYLGSVEFQFRDSFWFF